MANSNEDTPNTPTHNPDVRPTSEVGFGPTLTMQEHVAVMRELFLTPARNPRLVLELSLPRFNPGIAGTDAATWCATASVIMRDRPIRDGDLYLLLSSALEGVAARWLSQIPVDGLTWTKFTEYFLSRFGTTETITSMMVGFLNEQQLEDETTGAFGHRLHSLLWSRWENLSMIEVVNAFVLYRLRLSDKEAERLAFTRNIRTREQFYEEMRAFSYARKGLTSSSSDPPTEPGVKRSRTMDRARCYHCGIPGHKMTECRKRMRTGKTRTRRPGESRSAASSGAVCYKCRAEGHIAPDCPLREERRGGHDKERRVHTCVVEASTGKLGHQGESFPFCFDSGAECSLIKESVAPKFSGRRTTEIVVMRGIGNTCVKSTTQILSTVCIDGFTLEITFHVLPDSHLKYDIMIGREILSQGFDVHITSDSLEICKTKTVNACNETPENEVDLSEVDTEELGNDKSRLISTLERFKNSFITGFPRTRVTTGQLEIRLIDPNVTVQRSPYRLSEEERKTVRERISELIKANIIRPSKSPFASPMLLVKKKDGSDRLCVDFRALNKNTVADRYPLPLIADQIARLQNAKYFISLDMASGFHQIPIHPNSTEYTAFVTPDGQYEYVTMPFGLKNAPSVFQRAIFNALGDLAYSYVVVYLDDVLVIADSIDQALERLNTVLDTLVKAGFSFNFAKCSFLKTTVLYLGYIIHNGEVRPNPGKIHALSSLPAPTTVTQLRQFIGLASYFRRFVPKFSQMMKPLYALTSGSKT